MRLLPLLLLVFQLSFVPLLATTGGYQVGVHLVDQKLERLVLESVEFEEVELAKAIELVRAKSREADSSDLDEADKGLRIGFDRPNKLEARKLITLSMKDVPVRDVLVEIARQTERRLEVFGDGVVLRRVDEPLVFEGLFTRTYRVPPDFVASTSVGSVDDPFALEKPPESGDRRQEKKRPTAREILESYGILFSEGAAAVFDPRRSVLIVRNNSQNHELIETLVDERGVYYPNFVRIRLEVYTVANAKAIEISRRSAHGLGGHRIWNEVRKALDGGDAELNASQELVTRSGQRSKLEAGWNYPFVEGYEFKDGVDRPVFESVFVGKSIEVDPVVGADGETIELNIAFSISRGEPKMHRREIRSPSTGKPLDIESVELDAASLTTALTTRSGAPMYIGILRSGDDDGRAQIAFVTASVADTEVAPLPE